MKMRYYIERHAAQVVARVQVDFLDGRGNTERNALAELLLQLDSDDIADAVHELKQQIESRLNELNDDDTNERVEAAAVADMRAEREYLSQFYPKKGELR